MEIWIPPGFEADTRRAQQLQEQMQRDPRAIFELIQVYEQMVERLQPDKVPLFYGMISSSIWATPTRICRQATERAAWSKPFAAVWREVTNSQSLPDR